MKRPLETVYIMRVWVEESQELPHNNWRFVLQDPHTGQRTGFISPEAVIGYLLQQTAQNKWSYQDDSDRP